MKNVKKLVSQNNLKIIDAIVLKKRFIGMVDHYVLFGGFDRNEEPIFVANYKNGVQVVPRQDMIKYLSMLEPERIVRFIGTENERLIAVQRAKSRLGEKAYKYFSNNCEHFVTWVHTGRHSSRQVSDAGEALMIAGSIASIGGLSKKNNAAMGVGLASMFLGALLKYGLNDSEK
ncbi:MAG: hypothetical protein COA32_16515 [Fluviicola sp.]|nr:MAG: hypothetical protein COA32_16515 [Fluviicola sp.]